MIDLSAYVERVCNESLARIQVDNEAANREYYVRRHDLQQVVVPYVLAYINIEDNDG